MDQSRTCGISGEEMTLTDNEKKLLVAAVQASRASHQMFYIEIGDAVFQIYPGGRTIAWPKIQRYLDRALRDAPNVQKLLAGSQERE
jgi:hypothetical protein